MDNIQLKNGRTIEPYYGRFVDKLPALLEEYSNGKGIILSEVDIRFLGVRNFKQHPEIAKNYWDTSTLSATKGEIIKVIFPYKTGNRTLTDVARFSLGLINPDESLVNGGINLDINDRWEKLEGSGVYTLQRKGLILDRDLTKDEALNHKLLLIKLGHPDCVDSKFTRSKDEITEIIGKTFELGKKEYGYDTMMNQYLPNVSGKGVLKTWCVDGFEGGAVSNASFGFNYDSGRFAFESIDSSKARTRFYKLYFSLF